MALFDQSSFAKFLLIGRDAELADMHAAYHNAVTPGPSGGLGCVTARVIYGEMGIGKTALVQAFLSELPPDARVHKDAIGCIVLEFAS